MNDAEAGPAMAAMSAWTLTLTDPLFSLHQRARIEDDLARLHVAHRDVVHRFWAGVCADLARSLPDGDPWRHLSAMWGDVVIGDPPGRGAWTAQRLPFGTWSDAGDLVPNVLPDPSEDPDLAVLAMEPMSPPAAAILASGAGGWRTCLRMLEEVDRVGFPRWDGLEVVADEQDREAYSRGAALHATRQSAGQAIRWLVHRRRCHLSGQPDPWVQESGFRWAWRAWRSVADPGWSDEDVEQAITSARIRVYKPLGFDEF